MVLSIEKSPKISDSNITFIGLANEIYGRPQYVLVNPSDSNDLKFPGLRFKSPSVGETLEDVAIKRFQEQTGLKVTKSLGLRSIISGKGRHDNSRLFRNVFLGVVDGTLVKNEFDGLRKIYVADAGSENGRGIAYELGSSQNHVDIKWATPEDHTIAELATDCLSNFDWVEKDTSWVKRIPCVGVKSPFTDNLNDNAGCGMAVANMMVVFHPNPKDKLHFLMVRRKGDDYPGYAGGKVESQRDINSQNLDPISCCIREGAEEFGFGVMPLGLIGVACTPLEFPSEKYYNSIITYSFIARPINLLEVREAMRNPRSHLEGKMEAYVLEDLMVHRDRVNRGELRMPDMVEFGKMFFRGKPGERIPLTQIIDSGVY
ncbi:hypothetical protein COU59_01385 [Candidatus Pacearchaeota archaeon CG10_big_fil_rev_8_21_14_0_10_34_12]|nr:MAG: hypothetical protein COU59_01385 [Candidatus Pacearchaeota archaeon CG10_big_fil_rev_8_21_14_0_10_34_12]